MLNIFIPKDIDILIDENWIKIKGPLGIIKKKKSNLIKISFDKTTRQLYLLNTNKQLNHFYISILYSQI